MIKWNYLISHTSPRLIKLIATKYTHFGLLTRLALSVQQKLFLENVNKNVESAVFLFASEIVDLSAKMLLAQNITSS